jgi:hypothetical protein
MRKAIAIQSWSRNGKLDARTCCAIDQSNNVPRGQSLGAAWYLPEERLIVRPDQMLDEMCHYGRKSCSNFQQNFNRSIKRFRKK